MRTFKRTFKPIIFTKEGLENAKKKYKVLQESRPAAVAELKRARDLGDLSENGLYKAARARLSSLDNQLTRLEFQIKLAVIPQTSSDTVGIGSKVIVLDGADTREFHIVGDLEASPSHGKISQHSPIGQALFGKKVGENVVIQTPNGTTSFTIKKIL